MIPTVPFFFGMKEGEDITVEIDHGKTLLITFLHKDQANDEGYCNVRFKLNGQTRTVSVKDESIAVTKVQHRKVDTTNENEIGAPLQGMLSKIFVAVGEEVSINTPLFVIEAMKMETTVTAMHKGIVKQLIFTEGTMLRADDLVVILGSSLV